MAVDDAHSEWSLPVFMESLSFSNEHTQAPRLLPVQNLIFDILERDIPLKLLRVSKPLYDRIIPTIYNQVTLTNGNIVPFFKGLIIQKRQDGNGKTTFTLGERKLKVLSHIKSITFIDRPTAEKFSKMMKLFANQVYHSSESPMVFPSVDHVHLEAELVDVLFTTFDDMTRPETISMMLSVWIPMFLFALGKHAQPSMISIDWPLEWSGDKDIDFWDEPGLPFAANSFFEKLIYFTKIKRVFINVSEFDLSSIWLSFLIEDENIEIFINVYVAEETQNWMLFHTILDHFQLVTYDGGDEERMKKNLEGRLTYVLPGRKGLSEELDQRCQQGREYQEVMSKLKEMIVFRGNDLADGEDGEADSEGQD